jgi:hypothetical protein
MSFMFRFNSIFFVEDAGELCIIILEEKGQSPKLHIYILTPHKKNCTQVRSASIFETISLDLSNPQVVVPSNR